MKEDNTLRIVPNKDGGAFGTKVMVGDNELYGVKRVELVADPDNGNQWLARITVFKAEIDGEIAAKLEELKDVELRDAGSYCFYDSLSKGVRTFVKKESKPNIPQPKNI